MITQVEARSALGELLTLVLDDVSDGLVLEDIDGLDPVKATLVSSPFAKVRGAQYQASRRETRNIVISLSLEPDYVTTTVSDLRDNLYNFFMPDSAVDLRFFDGDRTVDISGRVESCDSPLFVKEPKATISIVCFDPDFVALEAIEIEEDTVGDSTEFLITYDGSVETGIIFNLLVDRTLTEVTIYHRPADDLVRTTDLAVELEADDVLTWNTNVGSKALTLTRAAVTSSVLYGISSQSNWLQLLRGDNYIRVFAEGDPIPFTIEYTPRYGGL